MAYILSLDAGTTSVRAIVFDDEGRIQATAQREILQIFPAAGWVEHDPHEIWSSQMAVATEALQKAGLSSTDVAALGITNQRETVVVWDKRTGEAVYNAIVWQDRRTARQCDELREAGHEPFVEKVTGLRIDPYFSATKLAWILDTVPDARRRAEAGELCFGTVDSWLIWKLTSQSRVFMTDPSNACRTLLYNLHTGDWDDELLKIFRIPRSMLPSIRSSSEIYGTVSAQSEIFGIVIAGSAGDQQAALFGQLCVNPGMAKNTYGTGCFLLQNIGKEPTLSQHRLVTSVAAQQSGARDFVLEGSVFVGGAVLQWLRDGMRMVSSVQEIDELADSVVDSNGVFFVPAFTGLGAPHWDPYARGSIAGLTRDTSRAHLARAALEGIAFQVADLMHAMHADTGTPFAELRVDGGGANSTPLLQIQADLAQVPVVRPAVVETTALGAAYLAGLAVGVWKSVSDLDRQTAAERIFTPRMSIDQAQSMRARWRRALDRSRGWALEEDSA